MLCAGAIGTPQVLIRSGIGPEQELKRLAIPPVWTNDDIGEHLQDHLEIYVQAGIKKPVSIYPSTRGLRKLKAGVERSKPFLLCAIKVFSAGETERGTRSQPRLIKLA